MGLITGLLFLPVTGPIGAFRWMLERLHDEAQAVLRDEGRAFAELIDLSMRHNAGQLTDAEYAQQETELLARLTAIREEKNELLYGTRMDDEADDADAIVDDGVDDEAYVAADATGGDEETR
jgi:hypothetical protein